MNNNYTSQESTGSFELKDAVEVCKIIEGVCVSAGFHVALTGGTLYGEQGRKDIDIVFYRIRGNPAKISTSATLSGLLERECDMKLIEDHGFVKKYLMGDYIPIDAMFPHVTDGEYDSTGKPILGAKV